MKTVILDAFSIKDGKLRFEDEKNEFWGKYYEASNRAIKMYSDLYRKGKLNDICDYITKHETKDGYTVISFVIDRDKLSDDFIKEIEEKYPDNGLLDCTKQSPCTYCRCIGFNFRPYSTYRSTCGCVGRSFEHPFVMGFYPKDANDFYEIASSDPVKAGIEVIKRMWGESDIASQTEEEYYLKQEEEAKLDMNLYNAFIIAKKVFNFLVELEVYDTAGVTVEPYVKTNYQSRITDTGDYIVTIYYSYPGGEIHPYSDVTYHSAFNPDDEYKDIFKINKNKISVISSEMQNKFSVGEDDIFSEYRDWFGENIKSFESAIKEDIEKLFS